MRTMLLSAWKLGSLGVGHVHTCRVKPSAAGNYKNTISHSRYLSWYSASITVLVKPPPRRQASLETEAEENLSTLGDRSRSTFAGRRSVPNLALETRATRCRRFGFPGNSGSEQLKPSCVQFARLWTEPWHTNSSSESRWLQSTWPPQQFTSEVTIPAISTADGPAKSEGVRSCQGTAKVGTDEERASAAAEPFSDDWSQPLASTSTAIQTAAALSGTTGCCITTKGGGASHCKR